MRCWGWRLVRLMMLVTEAGCGVVAHRRTASPPVRSLHKGVALQPGLVTITSLARHGL